jgi:hypothetical protein
MKLKLLAGPGGLEPLISGLEGLHVDVNGGIYSVPYPDLATGPNEKDSPDLIRLSRSRRNLGFQADLPFLSSDLKMVRPQWPHVNLLPWSAMKKPLPHLLQKGSFLSIFPSFIMYSLWIPFSANFKAS